MKNRNIDYGQEDKDQLIRHYAGLAMQAHVSKNGTLLFDEEDAKRCIKVATVLANTLKGEEDK